MTTFPKCPHCQVADLIRVGDTTRHCGDPYDARVADCPGQQWGVYVEPKRFGGSPAVDKTPLRRPNAKERLQAENLLAKGNRHRSF
jgi:hypothetical protein